MIGSFAVGHNLQLSSPEITRSLLEFPGIPINEASQPNGLGILSKSGGCLRLRISRCLRNCARTNNFTQNTRHSPHVYICFVRRSKVFVSSCRSASGTSATSAPKGSSGGGDKPKHTSDEASVFAANNSTLEIVAYQVFACGLGRRHSRRQRVVLTAESLWQRRRCLHPDATLIDRPPLEPTDWLIRDTEYLKAQRTEKGNGTGEIRADGNGLGGEPNVPVDGHRGGGRKGVAHKALEDIVKMVTFGSPGSEDAGVSPDVSRGELTLLHCPCWQQSHCDPRLRDA